MRFSNGIGNLYSSYLGECCQALLQNLVSCLVESNVYVQYPKMFMSGVYLKILSIGRQFTRFWNRYACITMDSSFIFVAFLK